MTCDKCGKLMVKRYSPCVLTSVTLLAEARAAGVLR